MTPALLWALAWGGEAAAQEALPGEGDGPALALNLELAGEGRLTLPDAGISRELRLARAMVGLGLGRVGPASARVQLDAVRSGGDTGYIGVAGESIVPRFQVAEARLDLSLWGALSFVAGLVDDPWVQSGQDLWGLRSLGPVMAEEQGWMSRSDLGAGAGWRAPAEWVELRLGIQSGEGLATRERNDGQDLLALVEVRPLAGVDPELLELSLMGREGSRGVALARDHRLGARISAARWGARAGVEALAGWGQDSDPTQLPGGISAWLTTEPHLPVLAWGRLDLTRDDRRDPATGASTWRLGAGPALGGRAQRRAVYAVAGVEGRRFAEDGAALAGAGDAAASTAFFLQLGSQIQAQSPLSLLP